MIFPLSTQKKKKIMFIHTDNVASLRTPYPSKFVLVSKVDLLYNNIIVYDIKMIYYIIR